jgi:hypothetical protein
MGIIGAFILYSYIMFGKSLANQSTIAASAQSAMRVFFWDLAIFGELAKINPLSSLLFNLMFSFMILLLLGNMFIAIIGSAYSDQRDILYAY